MLLGLEVALVLAVGACKGTLYLTIDTGSMSQADRIAQILNQHQVKATFFLANEPTIRNDFALDDSWAPYWKARVAEGHKFGSHTWRQGYYRADSPAGKVRYVVQGKLEVQDQKAVQVAVE